MLSNKVQGKRFEADILYDKGGEISHIRIAPAFKGSEGFFAGLQYCVDGGIVSVQHELTAGDVTIVKVTCEDSESPIPTYLQAVLEIAQYLVKTLDGAADASNEAWY